jgi:hypothetical protein
MFTGFQEYAKQKCFSASSCLFPPDCWILSEPLAHLSLLIRRASATSAAAAFTDAASRVNATSNLGPSSVINAASAGAGSLGFAPAPPPRR